MLISAVRGKSFLICLDVLPACGASRTGSWLALVLFCVNQLSATGVMDFLKSDPLHMLLSCQAGGRTGCWLALLPLFAAEQGRGVVKRGRWRMEWQHVQCVGLEGRGLMNKLRGMLKRLGKREKGGQPVRFGALVEGRGWLNTI